MTLLAIKKYYKDEINEKNDDYEIGTFRNIEEIVHKWISQQKLEGVLNCYESDLKKNITN